MITVLQPTHSHSYKLGCWSLSQPNDHHYRAEEAVRKSLSPALLCKDDGWAGRTSGNDYFLSCFAKSSELITESWRFKLGLHNNRSHDNRYWDTFRNTDFTEDCNTHMRYALYVWSIFTNYSFRRMEGWNIGECYWVCRVWCEFLSPTETSRDTEPQFVQISISFTKAVRSLLPLKAFLHSYYMIMSALPETNRRHCLTVVSF